MNTISPTQDSPLGAGLTSVVLGAVGVLLFFLPILSIPLGAAGVLFGLAALALAARGSRTSLRWAIAGLIASGLALGLSLSIAEAPAGSLPSRSIPINMQPVTDRPYVPPPARPDH